MANIFDKNSITDTEYEWFKNKLDNNFSIPDDRKSKVIFGFNGIGKSTIFKCIGRTKNDKIDYLEYGDLKTQLIKGKDTIVISPNINLIAQLNSKIEPLKPSLNAQKNLKDTFGFKKADDVKLFGQKIQTAWKNKSFSGFVKTKADIGAIEKSLSGIPPKVFIGSITEISAVKNAQQELQDEKDHALFHVLNSLDKITNQADSVCPICGNNAPNLKQTIQAKMNFLSNKQSALIEKLKQVNITADENLINNLVLVYGKINADTDLKADYLLCSGSSSTYDTLNQNLITVQKIEIQLQPLVAQAKSSYTNIKNMKTSLEADLKRYFKVAQSNVTFSDADSTVTIKLPREIKTYSTGELNLLSFLYKVYSFIGSDKSVLLLDDPVSSLDLINHYKIAYEIVKTSTSKTLIVLTHSTEFVNVVNSQYPNQFAFFYLEESGGVISLQEIPFNPSEANPNIIVLDKLADTSGFPGFIQALKTREENSSNTSIQRLFHFTSIEEHLDGDTKKFSNYDLISLIENFTSFTQTNFYEDSYIKVQYLCALRVWLEKKLYSIISNLDTQLQKRFINEDTINKKIDCVL
ncbi:MAG: hypothetical protein M0P49_04435, partial [Bacilli bacterium]|nr:hypothetical protein [Bacilli bacterium]